MNAQSHSRPPETSVEDPGSFYDRALALMQYQVEFLWLIFGAFLLAETVLLAGIASVMKDDPEPWLFGGALLGLVLTVPWWSSFSQNYHYYLLRVAQAKRFEPDAGSFLTEGACLAAGHSVSQLRMPWLARVLPPRRGVPLLVVAFAFAFLAIAIAHAPRWHGGRPSQGISGPTLGSTPNIGVQLAAGASGAALSPSVSMVALVIFVAIAIAAVAVLFPDRFYEYAAANIAPLLQYGGSKDSAPEPL